MASGLHAKVGQPAPDLRVTGLVGVGVDTEKDAPVAEYARARVTYPIYRLDPAEMERLYKTRAAASRRY